MMKRPIPLLYRGDAFSDITSSVEENDSITSLIAAVELGRGVAKGTRLRRLKSSRRRRFKGALFATDQFTSAEG